MAIWVIYIIAWVYCMARVGVSLADWRHVNRNVAMALAVTLGVVGLLVIGVLPRHRAPV